MKLRERGMRYLPEFVELIKKIEYITLEQFIPNWTEMVEEMDENNIRELDRMDYAEKKGLRYTEHRFCLVGEAYHNNKEYAFGELDKGCCFTCRDFSIYPASKAMDEGKETSQNFKLKLFTHMLEPLPNILFGSLPSVVSSFLSGPKNLAYLISTLHVGHLYGFLPANSTNSAMFYH